jgi:hypothetical protein
MAFARIFFSAPTWMFAMGPVDQAFQNGGVYREILAHFDECTNDVWIHRRRTTGFRR